MYDLIEKRNSESLILLIQTLRRYRLLFFAGCCSLERSPYLCNAYMLNRTVQGFKTEGKKITWKGRNTRQHTCNNKKGKPKWVASFVLISFQYVFKLETAVNNKVQRIKERNCVRKSGSMFEIIRKYIDYEGFIA